MGLITGSIYLDESREELAYSEDPGVVCGASTIGTAWRPARDFERLTDEADLVEVRNLNTRERTHYRNFHARSMPADANLYAVKTAVERVTTKLAGKVQRLKGAKALEWVEAVARTNPVALDLLADRIIHRSSGKDPAALYPDMREVLGYPRAFELDEQEVPDDGATKSDEGAGA